MNKEQIINFWNLWNDHFDDQGVELQAMLSLVDFSGKKVLEIGCGNGRISRLLGPLCNQLIAIDNDALMLEAAEVYPNPINVKFQLMDALNLEFDNDIYDVIVFSWVLTCLQGHEIQALTEAKRVIKKGGKVLIVDFGNYSEYDQIVKPFVDDSNTYTTRTDEANITELLRDIFLEPVNIAGPLRAEYLFDSESQFSNVVEFAIREFHHSKIADRKKFKNLLSKNGRGYAESVICYCVEK
jgi:ubiquinone/menaquinone biosynthesis C-methylase UbiE